MAEGMWKGLEKQIKDGKVVPGEPVYIGSRLELRRYQERVVRRFRRERRDFKKGVENFYLD